MQTKRVTCIGKRLLAQASVLLSIFILGCAWTIGGHGDEQRALVLSGLGDHHHQITTNDTLVQRLFDQGLILSYARPIANVTKPNR